MNKKFISALLFGALLFASTSTFVSCSYDEDIAELRGDLDKTATDLTSLVDQKMSTVETEIDALGAQAEALEGAYQAALEAIQAAKTEAELKIAEAEAATIAAAKALVDDAKAELQAALTEAIANQDKTNAALAQKDAELTQAIAAAVANIAKAQALAEENAKGLVAVNEKLTALESLFGKEIKDLTAKAAALEADVVAQAAIIEELKKTVKDGDDANAAKIEALETALVAAKAELQAAVANAEKVAKEAVDSAKTALTEAFDAKLATAKKAYEDADKVLEQKITDAKTELEGKLAEQVEAINQKINAVNANIAFQSKKLKSLVFNPNLYYGGIEAIGVYSFNYKPYQALTAGNVEENQVGKIEDKQQDSYVRFVPNEQISYIMNPSNAVVSKDVANYGFILNHARYTRADRSFDASDILVKNVVANDGKLTLTINMTDPDLIANIADKEVDVIALKYTDKGENGDTAIVSDFAAIKHWEINDFSIHSTKHECAKLHATPQAAVEAYKKNGIYYTVAYTGKIDLKEQIDVHYTSTDAKKSTTWGNWETIAEKNFRFEYELIGYIANDETKTNESKHAKLDGSVLIPQTADGKEANRSAVGRTPLVRIKLIDGNNNNNVVAVAYTIVAITDVSLDPISFAYGSTAAFEVVCDPADFTVGYMPTWTEFEQQILSHERIGLSKSDFHSLYELDVKFDVDGTTKIALQFDEAGKEVTVPFGKVTEVVTGTGYETNVLKWIATNNEAYTQFKLNDEGQRNTSKSVIVRYKPRNTQAVNHRPYIYLTLTWTPSEIETEPVAGITDNDKVANVWYAADANAAGFSDLHAHVNQDKGAPKFNFGVDNGTFRLGANNAKVLEVVKASLKANGYDKDEALANNADVDFKFATVVEDGVSYPAYNRTAGSAKGGKAYTLTVENNATEVWAHNDETTKELVATISTEDGTITYKDTEVAQDILNYAESFDLAKGQTLTLQVELVATTCAPASSIALDNNMVNVKFVRPLNLDDKTTVQITDSKAQIQNVALGKNKNEDNTLEIKFYDWRNYNNEQVHQHSGQQYNIYELYNITSIQQNTNAKVTTNYTGEWAEVDEKLFNISYSGINGTPVVKSKEQGTITYEKKTSLTVRNFQARIPVVVSYYWGNIYTYITVEVSATDGDN